MMLELQSGGQSDTAVARYLDVATMNDDDGLLAFDAIRPRLFGIAYRMLGSVVEAEDVIQSAWLRWQVTDRSAVLDADAFLITMTTRIAINQMKAARVHRERYSGVWLPEPVDTANDPCLGAERAEGLELAVLMLLEKLTPNERAAYVLREAFDYPHDRIAEVLRLSTGNVRQLVSRARQHITNGRHFTTDSDEHGRLLEAFVTAARDGDIGALEDLFAADVASHADGGGIVRAARFPVVGRERVAKFMAAISAHFWAGVTLRYIEANSLPAVVLLRGDKPVVLATITASQGRIENILWVMRPSKLEGINW